MMVTLIPNGVGYSGVLQGITLPQPGDPINCRCIAYINDAKLWLFEHNAWVAQGHTHPSQQAIAIYDDSLMLRTYSPEKRKDITLIDNLRTLISIFDGPDECCISVDMRGAMSVHRCTPYGKPVAKHTPQSPEEIR